MPLTVCGLAATFSCRRERPTCGFKGAHLLHRYSHLVDVFEYQPSDSQHHVSDRLSEAETADVTHCHCSVAK
jgi:hypothetical protein